MFFFCFFLPSGWKEFHVAAGGSTDPEKQSKSCPSRVHNLPQPTTQHFTHFCLLMLFIIIAKMGGIKSVYSSNGNSDFGTLNFLSGLIFIFLIQPRRELQKMLPIKLKICFDLFYQKIVAVAVTLLSDFCLCLFF